MGIIYLLRLPILSDQKTGQGLISINHKDKQEIKARRLQSQTHTIMEFSPNAIIGIVGLALALPATIAIGIQGFRWWKRLGNRDSAGEMCM